MLTKAKIEALRGHLTDFDEGAGDKFAPFINKLQELLTEVTELYTCTECGGWGEVRSTLNPYDDVECKLCEGTGVIT